MGARRAAIRSIAPTSAAVVSMMVSWVMASRGSAHGARGLGDVDCSIEMRLRSDRGVAVSVEPDLEVEMTETWATGRRITADHADGLAGAHALAAGAAGRGLHEQLLEVLVVGRPGRAVGEHDLM